MNVAGTSFLQSEKFQFLAFTLALILLGGVLIIKPMITSLHNDEDTLGRLENELAELSIARKALNGGQVEQELEAQQRRLEQQLPDRHDATLLLQKLHMQYQPHDSIEFHVVDPLEAEHGAVTEAEDGSPITGPGFLPVRVEFATTYAEMVRYLNFLEQQDWIIAASELHVKRDEARRKQLDVKAVVRIALAPDSGQQPQAGQTTRDLDAVTNFIKPIKVTQHIPEFSKIRPMAFVMDTPVNAAPATTQKQSVANTKPPAVPTFMLEGFLDGQVIINEEFYREQDTVDGWTIQEIHPTDEYIVLQQGTIVTQRSLEP